MRTIADRKSALWETRRKEREQAAETIAALTERVAQLETMLADARACNCETESDNAEDHLRDCPYRSAALLAATPAGAGATEEEVR